MSCDPSRSKNGNPEPMKNKKGLKLEPSQDKSLRLSWSPGGLREAVYDVFCACLGVRSGFISIDEGVICKLLLGIPSSSQNLLGYQYPTNS